jgi:putative flavoprotein involved in K+ transport
MQPVIPSSVLVQRRHFPVIVIGAGPSGLALGRELRTRQIDFIILEKGEVASSWAQMPEALRLVSPWKCNLLHESSRAAFPRNAQVTRAQYLDYLRHFARDNALRIATRCEVLSVRSEGDGFAVETAHGLVTANIVVLATGYFSNPALPNLPGCETTGIRQIHYAEYGSSDRVASLAGADGLVLIVGKRLSAGQVALELVDRGLRVAVSCRSSIQFGVDDWLWPFVYRNFAMAEAVRLKLGWGTSAPLDVCMPGGRVRRFIESGVIRTCGPILRLDRNIVVFADGTELRPQVLLYATGFAPTLKPVEDLGLACDERTGVPLTRDMESVSVRNLFFLGFELLRNFQSRFLRGIRKDSAVLAQLIGSRLLAPRASSQPACVS